MSRCTEIRIAHNLLPRSVLDEPFGYIGELYDIDEFMRTLPVDTVLSEPGDFPNNIEEFYWIKEGAHDEEFWEAVGKLTNGSYFFYTAGCDYTGFDCQGTMKLILSPYFANLVQYGMPEASYQLYDEACTRV
jgi:hypothetical protein